MPLLQCSQQQQIERKGFTVFLALSQGRQRFHKPFLQKDAAFCNIVFGDDLAVYLRDDLRRQRLRVVLSAEQQAEREQNSRPFADSLADPLERVRACRIKRTRSGGKR